MRDKINLAIQIAAELKSRQIKALVHDPYNYVLKAFPWGQGALAGKSGPREWQKERLQTLGDRLRQGDKDAISVILSEIVNFGAGSGHGVGKSALVAWIILWAIDTVQETRGTVTANTEKQLMAKTWPELAKWYNLWTSKSDFTLTATAIFSKQKQYERTWRIDAIPWSDNNTEAFAGLHNEGKRILLIFDEASAISDKIWEVAEGALTDENTEIIWGVFGNITRNTGRFFECNGKFRNRWDVISIDARNVEGTNKEQIKKWEEDYGVDSDFFKVRVRGLPPSSSQKQFISTDLVDAALDVKLEKHQYDFAPVIITVDPAWEGDDTLEIGKRQGLHFEILKTIPKNDDDLYIAGLVAGYEDEFDADAVFIDLGYGTGIFSAGKAMNRRWILVNFAGKSGDIGCYNKRAEIWKKMRDWLKEGGSLGGDRKLYNELLGPETVSRLDGKIQIESKQHMKERGVPSPNRADALALSFSFPVSKKRKNKPKKQDSAYSVSPGGWMG